ncbi:MAG: hypothetical protein JWQ98_1069 [Chlorobi bacterium]|nr:hypothetical protein [Chlorobiota bacterium]
MCGLVGKTTGKVITPNSCGTFPSRDRRSHFLDGFSNLIEFHDLIGGRLDIEELHSGEVVEVLPEENPICIEAFIVAHVENADKPHLIPALPSKEFGPRNAKPVRQLDLCPSCVWNPQRIPQSFEDGFAVHAHRSYPIIEYGYRNIVCKIVYGMTTMSCFRRWTTVIFAAVTHS